MGKLWLLCALYILNDSGVYGKWTLVNLGPNLESMHVSLNSERLISGFGVIVDYEPPPTLCMILCVFALGCLAIVFHAFTIVHRYPTFSLLTSEWFGGHRPFHLNFYSFIDVNSCT